MAGHESGFDTQAPKAVRMLGGGCAGDRRLADPAQRLVPDAGLRERSASGSRPVVSHHIVDASRWHAERPSDPAEQRAVTQ